MITSEGRRRIFPTSDVLRCLYCFLQCFRHYRYEDIERYISMLVLKLMHNL